ncbi:nucleoprotein TPR-like isoform X3 [Petromyzon marinus]|uniref:nucleoprotein TPR-like isoform X3 n=1 Tax=Petromyzon marinus TaxID=7757 RepID=UPI003F6F932D
MSPCLSPLTPHPHQVSSSGEVIASRLLTFRDVSELQQQNQRLLAVVRELSEQAEQEEGEQLGGRVKALRQELENAKEELAGSQAAREKQQALVESIVRQRDMYRVLLLQVSGDTRGLLPSPVDASPEPPPSKALPTVAPPPRAGAGAAPSPHPGHPPTAPSPHPGHPPTAPSPHPGHPPTAPTLGTPPLAGRDGETSRALSELHSAFKQLQAELEACRKERRDSDLAANELQERLRSALSEQNLSASRLSSQLEFANKRYEILQANVETSKREISSLRDKNSKLLARPAARSRPCPRSHRTCWPPTTRWRAPRCRLRLCGRRGSS